MSVCLITGHVIFDHLVKVQSARFIHYKVTLFSFVLSTVVPFSVGDTFQDPLS